LFTVGLTTATLRWLERPKFTCTNFGLCRTWLLVWCLECAEVNTSPQCLIYIGYLSVSECLQDGLDGLEVCSWCRSSLSQRPLRIRYTASSGRQHLRSAATGTLLQVPRARTATGQQSFAVNGPATWNRLLPALRSPDLSESAFKRALKMHLFSTARRH